MRWTPGGDSGDIEDRRGSSGFRGAPMGIGGAVILLVLSLLFGKNFFALFESSSATTDQPGVTRPVEETAQEHQEVQFVTFVLNDAQSTWSSTLGGRYRHAKLVLFREAIGSACGFAEAASGPFYCPENEKIYLDLAFFDELRGRFAASGDFAQAYVITHELGHHVQKILGIEPRVRALMQQDPPHANEYSVRLELQADCFAGVWGHSTAQRNLLESGDIEEGLNAAAAVGDDRLRGRSGRRVNPESFTHGSSRERAMWFRRGLDSGRIEDCDTFRGQVRQ
jgi:predicted metalloprotease